MPKNIENEQVLAELERILTSPSFRARKLIRTFLRYAVHETLAGRGNQLNQYSIAVHALGKPEDFSPVYNPVVRIEAGRLRKLLHDYYADADTRSTVMITMPKGTYQVAFLPGSHTQHQPHPTSGDMVPHVTEGPRILLSCQLLAPHTPADYPSCYKLRNDLLLMLSRFRNIRLVSAPAQESCLSAEPANLPTSPQRVDYTLHCGIQPNADGFELFCILTHSPSDELVWTNTLYLPAQPAQTDLDAVCLQVAANTVTLHSGKALAHWARYQQSLPAAIPAHQQVLVSYLNYLHDISRENFSKALQASEQRLEAFPDDSKALVIFARLCGYNHVLQYDMIPDMETVWTHAARMAMKLDPGNAEAHSVFAHNSFLRGDYSLCRAEFEAARQLNPFDTSIEYLYGLGLYLMGEQETGIQAINTLMDIPFTKPDWYHVLPFLHTFNQGDYQAALALAERIQQFGYWGELARCVSYFRLGQQEHCLAELQQLSSHNSVSLGSHATDQRSIFSHETLKKVLGTLQEIKQRMA